MKPYKVTLQHSVHANTPCVACHVSPTLLAGIKWRAKEWVNILAVYLNVAPASAKQQLPSNAQLYELPQSAEPRHVVHWHPLLA